MSEIHIERGTERNHREVKEVEYLRGETGGGIEEQRGDRRWNRGTERDRGRQGETEEKEVMPDALSPNCYPILSHKVTQI